MPPEGGSHREPGRSPRLGTSTPKTDNRPAGGSSIYATLPKVDENAQEAFYQHAGLKGMLN
ncbi:hypothetical protein ZHAS_00007045 [Anopheles sinensis]|uniref:Uncharacterized protein n=1 Tax=Anopheles sinensis TaxID=74873 RepID=A0A084VNR2_ANOSI|nr:hypothetical protein ZHAS_00007045 [Anopheles sinensis]